MFKRIILILIFSLSLFSFIDFSYGGDCKLGGTVGTSLSTCLNGSEVLQSNDLKVETGFKKLIVGYIGKISTILAILAVGSIAYGSMVIVTSVGADDKITKGRNIIKWALVGFLVLVSASGLVKILIYLVYGL